MAKIKPTYEILRNYLCQGKKIKISFNEYPEVSGYIVEICKDSLWFVIHNLDYNVFYLISNRVKQIEYKHPYFVNGFPKFINRRYR
jgi:hypothetical protein